MIKGASLYALEEGKGGGAADQTDGKLGTGNIVEIVGEIFRARVTRDVHAPNSRRMFPPPSLLPSPSTLHVRGDGTKLESFSCARRNAV